MAKLYFRYGPVCSAKTMQLLAVVHNYRMQKKRVLLLQPDLDTRFGQGIVRSRAELKEEADLVVSATTELPDSLFVGVSCVVVDEAQFLSERVVERLREVTIRPGVPVICYGLRTDFKRRLFPASKRLMELADSIEEIKTTCWFCNRKAVFNLKHVDGKAVVKGDSIELGGEERYLPVCGVCYEQQTKK